MAFNIVPNAFKPCLFMMTMNLCSEHKMLSLISAQLEAIECIAERYSFSDADKIMLSNNAISILKKVENNYALSTTLYKILLEYVKKYEKKEEIKEKIKMLYLLSVQLFNVSQYNVLVELKSYADLKNVTFLCIIYRMSQSCLSWWSFLRIKD